MFLVNRDPISFAQASADLDRKLRKQGIIHNQNANERAAAIDMDRKAKANATALANTGVAKASAAVNASYFGGQTKRSVLA
jgi:hypothetical protein